MKKKLTFAMTLIAAAMCTAVTLGPVLNASLSASAEGFVSSPSGGYTLKLVSYENADEECVATLKNTGYAQRDTLEEATRRVLETAYNEITSATDLTTLNADFAALVAEKDLTAATVSVSDLFDLSYSDCELHEEHGEFTVTMQTETVENIVALLHYNSGEWELVNNVTVDAENQTFTFTTAVFSPFAIIMDTSEFVTPEEPGLEEGPAPVVAVAGIAVGAALIMLVMALKN